ncbi:MAG: dihydropteroate synthase [Phycisphaerae bacterium]|jgi:dihydropteroate synthase
MHWRLSPQRTLDLSAPRIMAILNITPDSFADGGEHLHVDAALAHAQRCVDEGAAMLDIGGESTRPGAASVSEAQQIARVIPVVRAIRACTHAAARVPISIDTTRASVAAAALDAGADAINDVSAGSDDPAMLPLAAQCRCGIILMHRLLPPARDQFSDAYTAPPTYTDVVAEVLAYLRARVAAALDAGIARDCIMLDPGLGFGKSVTDNLRLIAGSKHLLADGLPLLSALSRKSFVGRVSLGRDSTPAERLEGTLALSVLHYQQGCRLFRVHDVAPHAAALAAAQALATSANPS